MTPLLAAAHVQVAATAFLAGLIWFVQVVHYPLFSHVDRSGFPRFQKAHEARTTWVVGPAMSVELAAAVAVAVLGASELPRTLLGGGLLLLIVIWLSTLLLQVPRHRILESGFDDPAHRFLVASNWVRTIAWTTRLPIAAWLLHAAMTGAGS
jgi:hypothetical protein